MVANIVLLVFSFAYAAENSCQNPKNYQEFYHCSLSKHPELEVSKLKISEGEAIEAQASEWQNPELEVKSVRGEDAGERADSTEVSLAMPLTQFWTRSARKEIGAAQKRIAEIESSEALLNVSKTLIHDLYRLRQIEDEIQIFDESLQSFEVLTKQFRGRSVRGPEQQVTFNLLELATSDYELKRNNLMTERDKILATFVALWGPEFKMKKEILPGVKQAWPDLSLKQNATQSFSVRKLVAESERAQAEQKLAEKEAWPAISAGPTIEQVNEGSAQVTSYGVNLTMTLPLLSQNTGARRLTQSRAQQATLLSEYAVKKAALEKEVLLQRYKSSVGALKKSSNKENVHKKHVQIDRLFRQGLVGGGMVIEAHRQIVDFTESQHAHELLAIQSFLEFKALSGESAEEIL